ncbi:conserved hypothetical protein [metagenome]|uniref:DUF3445 domain-containing protein n=1 Tax=metagenome TaxID=256318 RepID=A0A2P2C8M8_9ZZZZ
MSAYPTDVATFPWPMDRDVYSYSVNVQPGAMFQETAAGGWGEHLWWVQDGDYHKLLEQRAAILEANPTRYEVRPHMQPAAWDALLFALEDLSRTRPESFSLERAGREYVWRNALLGLEQPFVYGDQSTLPCEPLLYLAQQVVEDMVLLEQRENQLWMEGGILTFPNIWSLKFHLGMTFQDIHGPVVGASASGIFTRAEDFIMRMQPGEVFRRLNWNFQPGPYVDVSLEIYGEWLPDRVEFADRVRGRAGEFIYMRAEIQHLIRLPRTGAVLFPITTRLLPLERVAMVPEWSRRALTVIEGLPADINVYKGLDVTGEAVTSYLRERLAESPAT